MTHTLLLIDKPLCINYYVLEKWFSTFLMLQPIKTIPHVVVTPNLKIILLLFHNCNFANDTNGNVNISYATI